MFLEIIYWNIIEKLGRLMLIPVRMKLLSSWKFVEKYIFVRLMLQIVSAKTANSSQFLTGDEKLHQVAETENLNSIHVI